MSPRKLLVSFVVVGTTKFLTEEILDNAGMLSLFSEIVQPRNSVESVKIHIWTFMNQTISCQEYQEQI